jgi:AmmeMemoRadiSam system protein A
VVQAALPGLARQAIQMYLAGGIVPTLSGPPPSLAAPGACFVTLKRDGVLRGCIGSAIAWRPLAVDLIDNAIKAATQDPRFPAVTSDEFNSLALSVSLLTPPQPIVIKNEADLLAQLRPGIDGLIIEDGERKALFLPAVWTQIPRPDEFLGHLKRKAGMTADHWSDGFRAARFTAIEIAENRSSL